MKCCGENRSTPFCPLCGRKLEAEPLLTLKAYVRAHAEQLGRRLEILKAQYAREELEEDRSFLGKNIQSCERHFQKWREWLDALEAKNSDL